MKSIRLELFWFDHVSGEESFSGISVLVHKGYIYAFKTIFNILRKLYNIKNPPISNYKLVGVIIKHCIKTIKSDKRLSLRLRSSKL